MSKNKRHPLDPNVTMALWSATVRRLARFTTENMPLALSAGVVAPEAATSILASVQRMERQLTEYDSSAEVELAKIVANQCEILSEFWQTIGSRLPAEKMAEFHGILDRFESLSGQ